MAKKLDSIVIAIFKKGNGEGRWGKGNREIALSAVFKKGNRDRGTGNEERGINAFQSGEKL